MTKPWNQSVRTPRPTRPTYLPPHLRDQPTITVTVPASPPSRSPRPSQGRGGRGRGRSTRTPGGPTSQTRSWAAAAGRSRESFSETDPNQFHSPEKFDELEVIEGGPLPDVNLDAYDETPVESSGFDVPRPVAAFSEVDFSAELMDNIKRCKYVKPTPIQRYAIPAAMARRDLMACAQTGSGKTAAFCFPIISGILRDRAKSPAQILAEGRGMSLNMACPLALILAPTRELSCQIHDEAKKFSSKTGVKVAVAYGGAPIVLQLRNLEKGVDILVATPGRLVDMVERSRVSLRNVKYLALDEADRMLDMGFEPQVRRIVQEMEMPPAGVRQTMLFSATFPTEIQRLASDFLSNYIFLAAGKVGSSTGLIAQKIQFVHDMDKRSRLMSLLIAHRANGTQGKHALTLVFVETKRGADALQHWLSTKGFPSIAIHGDKVQMERERALRSFRSGATPILVATDVAARGLDVPHVAHVINFDLPRDIGDYVHRIGRTGRAGKSGLATAFFSEKNVPLAKALVGLMEEANQEVPPWLIEFAEANGSGVAPLGNRNSGVKFGGHDYRRGATLNNENYDDYTPRFGYNTVLQPYAASSRSSSSSFPGHASDAGYPTSARPNSFGDSFYSSHMYHHHRRPVVAGAWN